MLLDMEHNQRFKKLLRTFFAQFLRLFFADWAARFDLSEIDWLDKEMLAASPEGSLNIVDLVARVKAMQPIEGVHATEEPWLVLVHIEIESAEQTTRIKPKMPRYYHHLRAAYDLPVLPIVIYLNMHLEGIGEDTYIERMWDFEVNIFRYLYVALAGLDAVEYVKGENWLGVALAALMRIPEDRVAWLGAEALRRLGGAPITAEERFLLAECVRAYLPLDEARQQEYDRLLEKDPYSEVRAMNQTVYEKGLEVGEERGIEKGIEKGERLGQQKMVFALLQKRFGPVSASLRAHVESLSSDELSELLFGVASANSPAEAGLSEFMD